jgi:uncharacterized protein (DUF1800 family)
VRPISRRALLRAGAAGAAASALGGCDGTYRFAARYLGGGIPDSFPVAASADIDPDFHVLSRIGFGPRPGDLEAIRSRGAVAYIEDQLHPDSIDDAACDLLARRYESLHLKAGDIYEFKKRVAIEELTRAAVLRATFSRRQLFEVMVEFWTDHLNIDQSKAECVWLKTADDRDVVRRHALGRFRDLIRASALSPAMLVYLDGRDNKRRKPDDKPNENYARELLELHTLGVHGGYTQRDVMEVARCLTGWTVRSGWRKGSVEFVPERHDDGEKSVLGVRIPAGGGANDLDAVLDIVTRHASTARHIASKLCTRFVADRPPEGLVARATAAFAESDGDIRHVLRSILQSDEFRAARGARVKRPFRFIVSALRALAAETTAPPSLLKYFHRMGQTPFAYPTPDGYPDETAPWLGAMMWRWSFALELASNRIPGVQVRHAALAKAAGAEDPIALFPHFVGRQPVDRERDALRSFLAAAGDAREEAVAVILASPAFQRF